MSEPGFFDTLEAQLGPGLERVTQRRRTRRRVAQRVAGTVVAVLAAVGIGAFALRDEPAGAGVRVEQRDGLVYVRLTDIEYRADVIEDAARDAGIALSVEAVPAGPSLVGRFIAYEQVGEDTGELRKLDADGPAFGGFTIPADFDGRLVMQVGRPAAANEPYFAFSNALAEGEPLACSGVIGRTAQEALRIAESRGLQVRWTLQTSEGTRPVAGPAQLAEDVEVRRATSVAPGIVSILVSGSSTDVLSPVEQTADAIC